MAFSLSQTSFGVFFVISSIFKAGVSFLSQYLSSDKSPLLKKWFFAFLITSFFALSALFVSFSSGPIFRSSPCIHSISNKFYITLKTSRIDKGGCRPSASLEPCLRFSTHTAQAYHVQHGSFFSSRLRECRFHRSLTLSTAHTIRYYVL